MPVAADVVLPAEEFILGQVLGDAGEYYAELTQFVPTGDQYVPYLWIEDGEHERVERGLRDHPRIDSVTKYDRRAGRTLYQISWAKPLDALLSILKEVDVLVSEARGTPDVWEFELLANDQSELAAFQSACNERDIPIEIRTVFHSAPAFVDRIRITEKQREILQLAHRRGFFSVPRGVTVTELSEELGISPQAASKRLRRGLETAVGYVLNTPG